MAEQYSPFEVAWLLRHLFRFFQLEQIAFADGKNERIMLAFRGCVNLVKLLAPIVAVALADKKIKHENRNQFKLLPFFSFRCIPTFEILLNRISVSNPKMSLHSQITIQLVLTTFHWVLWTNLYKKMEIYLISHQRAHWRAGLKLQTPSFEIGIRKWKMDQITVSKNSKKLWLESFLKKWRTEWTQSGLQSEEFFSKNVDFSHTSQAPCY